MWRTLSDLNNGYQKDKVIAFLKKNDKELAVPVSQFPWWIEGTVNLFFQKGKIIVWEKQDEIIWLLWITFWEPSKNYENVEIWYLYLLLINKASRWKKDIVVWFFKKLLEEMRDKGIKTIRFKADATVSYNNRLYSKFANTIWCQKNTQWIDCNLYEADVNKLYESFFIENNFRPMTKQ